MKRVHLTLANEASSGTRMLPAPVVIQRQKSISSSLARILEETQRELGFRRAEYSTETAGNSEIEVLIRKVAERLGFELSNFERDEILAFIEKDEKPFGLLQPLVDDLQVSDIIVTQHDKISVQQGRRNFPTDLSFPNQEAFEAYVERLLQKAGTTYSTKKPIADGMIGSFARVHAVHRSLCDTGPYITIRLNRFTSVSLEDLASCGLAPWAILNYLKALIRIGQTILLCGEVGTGKTTLSRALAASIPSDEAILVIEDTPEIRLEHPHVRYVTTREMNSDGEGRVSPNECIRAGMRMAMNRIIFGEMRDAEAAEAFIDVCASGHPGLSTIHARSATEAISRLELFLGRTQRGANRNVFLEQIATAVQVIVFVDICRITGRRRITEIKEIGPVADGVLRQRDMFKYQIQKNLPTWKIINRVSAHRELLEFIEPIVNLSSLPPTLELDTSVLLQEVKGVV